MSNPFFAGSLYQERYTEQNKFFDYLSGYIFVDMGIITSAVRTQIGYRCKVNTFRIDQRQQVSYDDVELLCIGNAAGGFAPDMNGCSCIVFGPYSSATSIIEGRIPTLDRPYDKQYLKCLPVGNPMYWKGSMHIDAQGNYYYNTPTSVFKLTVDGAFQFMQKELQQQVSIDAEGIVNVFSEKYRYHHEIDGSYYRYCEGVSPGSISFFESWLDNIKDIYYDSIDNFVEVDNEESEWEQLLAHDSWRYHEHIEADKITITRKDPLGQIISVDEVDQDGSRVLTNTDSSGNHLFTRSVDPDGTLEIKIGTNDEYSLKITPDGKVDEQQKGDFIKTIDGDLNWTISGSTTIAGDKDVNIEATGPDVVTIKNAADTLGSLLNKIVDIEESLCTALSALHTEGSPAAHTGAAWAGTDIVPIVTTDIPLLRSAIDGTLG